MVVPVFLKKIARSLGVDESNNILYSIIYLYIVILTVEYISSLTES